MAKSFGAISFGNKKVQFTKITFCRLTGLPEYDTTASLPTHWLLVQFRNINVAAIC